MKVRLDVQPEPGDRPVVAARFRQRRVAPAARRSRAPARPAAGCAGRWRQRAPAPGPGASPRAGRGRPARAPPRPGHAPRRRSAAGPVQPARDGPEVEARPADEDRQPTPPGDRGQRLAGVGDVLGDAERLVRIDEVEAVVRDPRPVGGAHLGRPDVEAAVHLARVGREDLGRDPSTPEPVRQPEREPGLARRGRPGDDQKRRTRRHAWIRTPRSAYGPACSIRAVTSRPTSTRIRGDVDQLVLARPTRDGRTRGRTRALEFRLSIVVVRAARTGSLDEDLDGPPEPGAVALEPDRLLDGEQLVEPAPLLGRRHVVGQAGRRRPRTDRVGRREDLVVADHPKQVERRLELGLGLAAEADDDVGRDRDPRDRRPDRREPLEVVLDRVLAAHPPQDGVVARLDRAGGGARRPTGSRPSRR